MPAYVRREIVADAEVGIYHRVRRAFLCGDDPFTRRNCDRRKRWIQDRLEKLAGAFAIDVLGFAVLSNHLHVLSRRPPAAGPSSKAESLPASLRRFASHRASTGQRVACLTSILA